MSKKNMKIVIFLVALLIIFFSSICFCYFHFNLEDTQNYLVLSNVNNSGFDIKIDNSVPMTDELGKKIDSSGKSSYYGEFNISAKNKTKKKILYEIYLKNISSTNSISPNYIKLFLTDGKNHDILNYKNENVITFNNLKLASTDLSAKCLYKGTIKDNEIDKFKLRIWLADTYNVTNEDLEFKINLFVKLIK